MEVNHYRSQIDQIIDLAIKEDITDPLGIIPTGDHSALASSLATPPFPAT